MPEDEPDGPDQEVEDEFDEPAETPFDHPLFLPALLSGLAVWFGYDGFLNPEIESVMFNRVGFGVLVTLAAWYGYRGFGEMKERKRSARQAAEDDPTSRT